MAYPWSDDRVMSSAGDAFVGGNQSLDKSIGVTATTFWRSHTTHDAGGVIVVPIRKGTQKFDSKYGQPGYCVHRFSYTAVLQTGHIRQCRSNPNP
jgi:hypothetical protein